MYSSCLASDSCSGHSFQRPAALARPLPRRRGSVLRPHLVSAPSHPPRGSLQRVEAVSPYLTQDLIIGSAIVVAVGAAIFNGLKGEPVVCDECNGTGGLKCFACEGTGKMMGVKRDSLYSQEASDPSKRDFFGRDSNPRQCKVCGGSGLILCKKCGGSGYMKKL